MANGAIAGTVTPQAGLDATEVDALVSACVAYGHTLDGVHLDGLVAKLRTLHGALCRLHNAAIARAAGVPAPPAIGATSRRRAAS